jgi:hypothetical protein
MTRLPELLRSEDRLHATEGAFERYLKDERRLSAASLTNILPFVRRFLVDRFGAKPSCLASVSPSDITHFTDTPGP